MKYVIQLLFVCAVFMSSLTSANEQEISNISNTLNDYLQGTSLGNKQLIESSFIDNANLYLSKSNHPLWEVKVNTFSNWFKPKPSHTRFGKILNINVTGNIATAKLEITVPQLNSRYVDMFILKKINNDWKILSKTAEKISTNVNSDRILFIVSNAHFHGDSKLPAGVSFSEIVEAYDAFIQAGYYVDFVSPEGGAVPLMYINMSNPIHKQYVYNEDFMFQLAHTLSPDMISAEQYKAVHYLGGSNAMYGVAENQQLQDISMTIYEKYNGIVSSVCHGTAGIVNLKTQYGQYLVKGKRISGYPDEFEAMDKAYYQQFPFSIEQTVDQRGGKFKYGKANTSHIEVDGRVITGTNYQSSRDVAEAIIKQLQ